MTKASFIVPEVLQTSAMDCGPAALKSLLTGLGLSVNYQRLRDACRTGADGTSIDALEDICTALGLDATQELAPIAEAIEVLKVSAPAVVVVKGPGGSPHFIVVWKIVGPFVQVMDPARGRRWLRADDFLAELHEHQQVFDEETLQAWFPTTTWGELTRKQLEKLGSQWAVSDVESWRDLAALEASARLATKLVARKVLPRAGAPALIERLTEAPETVPRHLSAVGIREFDGALVVRGCVFLRVRRVSASAQSDSAPSELAKRVLGEASVSPLTILRKHLSQAAKHMALVVFILSIALVLLSFIEMFVLRAAFNAQSALALPQQRFWGTAMYAGLVIALLALDIAIASHVARLGRSLEVRCRMALMRKLPKLPDKYFRTRPMSDVTHRSQGLSSLRALPPVLVHVTRVTLDLVVTTVALFFVHPRGAAFTLLALAFGLCAPYVSLRIRNQLEHRVQSHASGLSQLYLDVLLGLNPLKTHGGQLAIRARQNELLSDWQIESERTVQTLTLTEAFQQVGTLLAVCAILGSFIRMGGEPGALLVLSFWALKLPVQARAFSMALQRVPFLLASFSRLLEPLTAEEAPEGEAASETTVVSSLRPGLAVEVRNLKATLGTHAVLDDVSVYVPPGQHVAIVGDSGAGKSSLLAAILGLIELDSGSIRADGIPVSRYDLARFRRETVWVDPTVQLWNRSLLENLVFGNPKEAIGEIGEAIERTDLKGLLEKLEEGMATPLGESGVRVSGGEGQRVRLSRSLLRRGARLILLDEAFRGLERGVRRAIANEVRRSVRHTTLIEVTHDVADTRGFDRILVIENGKLVEDGAPAELFASPSSRYHALVRADEETLTQVWSHRGWKRVRIARDGVAVDGIGQ